MRYLFPPDKLATTGDGGGARGTGGAGVNTGDSESTTNCELDRGVNEADELKL